MKDFFILQLATKNCKLRLTAGTLRGTPLLLNIA